MLRIMINRKFLYYAWLVFNCGLLVFSGYFQTLGTAFLKNDWTRFLELHTRLYPLDTDNLCYYDLMEFCLYTGIPILIMKFINKVKPSPRNSSYRVASLRKRIGQGKNYGNIINRITDYRIFYRITNCLQVYRQLFDKDLIFCLVLARHSIQPLSPAMLAPIGMAALRGSSFTLLQNSWFLRYQNQ